MLGCDCHECVGERLDASRSGLRSLVRTSCCRNWEKTTDCLLSTRGELHSYVDMPERLECPASGRNRQHP
jgi:hypothetical protein